MRLNQKHIDVATILVDAINKGEPIYYEYLRQKVNLGMMELWGYLGDLSI
ncbi:hypothetical protein [Romboutsia sp. 1001713B170207_170306_H8]|nr:hypothetical protein [Romboutsia sp. 1001713B170207_170306_H8]